MIVDKVNAYLNSVGQAVPEAILNEVGELAKWSFKRQFGEREETEAKLRLSAVGRCVRQQAYKLLGFEESGKSIDARARMVFFQGDLAEMAIVLLAKAAGIKITRSGKDQATVALDGIEGHPDGILEDNLLEVKSMSSFSFKDFERGVLDEGYRYQINAYMEALGLSKAIVVALNKDAGVLAEMQVSKDPAIVRDIKMRINMIRGATKESLPPRPFAPNDKGFYPWNCLYCAFHQTCLPTAEKVLVSNKYKLKEKSPLATPTPAKVGV